MKTRTETIAKLGRCRIEKQYDSFGNWNYVLLCDGSFIERSWSFEKLHKRMCGF